MGAPIVVVDFETEAIERRPHYPPKPVGVAIRQGGKSKYYAWGHPSENNCSEAAARAVLRDLWRSGCGLLFHNAKFDLEVAEKHFGLSLPPWHLVHDTLYLLFLADPHADTFSLKPSSERHLNLPPDEQDAVREWLLDHKVIRSNDKSWGAHIAKAPGGLVGRYAIGDVDRTWRLFKLLHPKYKGEAYDRERQLMPILLRNEQQGVCVAQDALKADFARYQSAMATVENYVRGVLKAPSLNLDADRELSDALRRRDAVSQWSYTPSGLPSVAKDALRPQHFKDPKLASALGYRNRLKTCLGTFMLPWLQMAQAGGGRIHTGWNQTRGERGGARTGRLSSSPNFQNIPKSFMDKNDGYLHPKHLRGLPELPLLRKYIVPDVGCVLLHRDYNQQELRITAHYEDGPLKEAYCADPRMDMHNYVQACIKEVSGLELQRRPVKIVNFLTIYGGGKARLAEQLNVSIEEAAGILAAHRKAMPGIDELNKDLKQLGRAGEPITTWGGRKYYCEPPKNDRTFEYKLLNYLVQGSAADCSKQAIINYDQIKHEGRFMLSVHDEMNLSVPASLWPEESELLRQAMEDVKFDVPMLTDAKYSTTNWGELLDVTAN